MFLGKRICVFWASVIFIKPKIKQMSQENPPKGHPAGLYLLFFTEMWERFSYYGMRAILILFLTKQLLFDKAFASDGIYGSFTGLVYLTPIIGGYVADRYWGNRKSILVGGLLMALGQFLLFFSGSLDDNLGLAKIMLYIGLGFIIFGNGFFKPNISTMVGQLYPENDRRIDGAYTIFYMGINLGAFLSPLICGYLGENVDFKWGFLAAGIGMLISTISFELLKNKYLVSPSGEQIGVVPNKARLKEGEADTGATFSTAQYGVLFGGGIALYLVFRYLVGFDFFGSLIFCLALAIPASIIMDRSLTSVEKSRIWVIYIAAFFVVFFWSAFEQAGASLTFFADEQTNRTIFGMNMPASWFNSFNAVFIVIFAPVFSFLWVKLNKAKKEPSAPRKQAWGLLFLTLGYVWIAWGVKGVAPGMKVSIMLLTILYLLHTWGELCLSPIGLSMVNKLAPARFASLLMGVWFLANATANKFAGILSSYYPEEQSKEAVYTIPNNAIKLDSATVFSWDNVTPTRQAPGLAMRWGMGDTLRKSKDSQQPDSLASLTLVPGAKYADINDSFKVRRTYPDPLKKVELKKLAAKGKTEPKYMGFMLDDKHFGVLRQGETTSNFEVWNLYPASKSFMGFPIKDLYDFFMIFIVMSGIASLILFAISGKLQKMMHGVR
jgi:proton-dependent oligopeptide transporter, POT family